MLHETIAKIKNEAPCEEPGARLPTNVHDFVRCLTSLHTIFMNITYEVPHIDMVDMASL